MSFFGNIGKSVVERMKASGEIETIVRNSMADQFEKLANEPQYAHVSDRLKQMAKTARAGKIEP